MCNISKGSTVMKEFKNCAIYSGPEHGSAVVFEISTRKSQLMQERFEIKWSLKPCHGLSTVSLTNTVNNIYSNVFKLLFIVNVTLFG